MSINAGISNTKNYYIEMLSGYYPFTNLISVAAWGSIGNGAQKLITNCAQMTLPYPYLSSPIQLKVSSTNVNDNGTGIGARWVVVDGLDENWELQSELVVLNGQTPVLTTGTYLRTEGIAIIAYGSNVNAIGDPSSLGEIKIGYGTVTAGTPQYILDCINIGDTTSRSAIFTVPAGFTAYMDRFTFFNEPRNNNLSIQINPWLKLNGNPPLNFHGKFNPLWVYGALENIQVPVVLPEKTDFQIRAYNDKSQAQFVSSYSLIELRENKI